jgi:hypothetical protein
MCTVVLLRRPGHDWPLLIAANRDEMHDRPWRPPDRHWPDRPDVIAGLDELAGGSWFGLNDHGVITAILNRRNTLGPLPGMRSRGELVLDALDHADARAAAEAIADLDAHAYRGFNLIIADQDAAFWVRSTGPDGPARPDVAEIAAGLSMITAGDLDDPRDPRIARYLPRWRTAPPPDPGRGAWTHWEALLESRDSDADGRGAMCFRLGTGFGTVSSTLVAVPDARKSAARHAALRFAQGHPDAIVWRDIPTTPVPGSVATLPTRTV